jgi:hypothetical protein
MEDYDDSASEEDEEIDLDPESFKPSKRHLTYTSL